MYAIRSYYGPKSLEVLRYVRDLGERAVCVLGNHDLHLICVFEGHEKARSGDTLDRILAAPDARELIDWLRARPLMHVERDYAMVHAGLLPQWTIKKARALAREIERALVAANVITSYSIHYTKLYDSSTQELCKMLSGSWRAPTVRKQYALLPVFTGKCQVCPITCKHPVIGYLCYMGFALV